MWGGPPDPAGVFDVEDAATALLRFDGGLSVQLNVAWAANVDPDHLRDGIVLLGDTGGCGVDLWRNELTITTERDGQVVTEKQNLPAGDAWDSAWRRQAERFCRCVETRTPPEASATDGRAVQTVIDALYRSAAEGREVEIGAWIVSSAPYSGLRRPIHRPLRSDARCARKRAPTAAGARCEVRGRGDASDPRGGLFLVADQDLTKLIGHG